MVDSVCGVQQGAKEGGAAAVGRKNRPLGQDLKTLSSTGNKRSIKSALFTLFSTTKSYREDTFKLHWPFWVSWEGTCRWILGSSLPVSSWACAPQDAPVSCIPWEGVWAFCLRQTGHHRAHPELSTLGLCWFGGHPSL